jgi:uncharacterized protein YaaQ
LSIEFDDDKLMLERNDVVLIQKHGLNGHDDARDSNIGWETLADDGELIENGSKTSFVGVDETRQNRHAAALEQRARHNQQKAHKEHRLKVEDSEHHFGCEGTARGALDHDAIRKSIATTSNPKNCAASHLGCCRTWPACAAAAADATLGTRAAVLTLEEEESSVQLRR